MTPEDLETMKVIRNLVSNGNTHIIHWYDILAIVIVGYWVGKVIAGLWWWI